MAAERASPLERWSRGHALFVLLLGAGAVATREIRLLAAGALLSFAWLCCTHRSAFRGSSAAPNAVTLLRCGLVCGSPFMLESSQKLPLALAAALVLALDGVDGWLARRLGGTSAFGAHFDMETDAAFILVLEAELWRRGELGAWILATGLLRYVYVLWTALAKRQPPPAPRSRWARHAFLVLALGLIAALILAPPLAALVAACASVPVAASFVRSFAWSYRASD